MGLCTSCHFTTEGVRFMGNWSSTIKVIHAGDGQLHEYQQPITASVVLSCHPNAFLCSSETMFINCYIPHIHGDEELQMGQIYFLMPHEKSNIPLSLEELCALAIKTDSALARAS
ncbi:uncharacterized protein [Rutidosis leptorrhynchoides]|uniref:uncharacterized protein n=1 Tax=Rutidosis leptorrhynchoides TaxID=125765 RepID=UPI003A9A3253